MKTEFPTGFGLSNNILQEYEEFILAQGMSWSSYRRKIVKRFDAAFSTKTINNKLVYDRRLKLENLNDIESEASLFLIEVMGVTESSLAELHSQSNVDEIDYIYLSFNNKPLAGDMGFVDTRLLSEIDTTPDDFMLVVQPLLINFKILTDSIHHVEIKHKVSISSFKYNPEYNVQNCNDCNNCTEDCENCDKYCNEYILNSPTDRKTVWLYYPWLQRTKDIRYYTRNTSLSRTKMYSTESAKQTIAPSAIKCFDENNIEINGIDNISTARWNLIKRVYALLYQTVGENFFSMIGMPTLSNEQEYMATDNIGDYSRYEYIQKTTISGSLNDSAINYVHKLCADSEFGQNADGFYFYRPIWIYGFNNGLLDNWFVYPFWLLLDSVGAGNEIEVASNGNLIYNKGSVYLKKEALARMKMKDWFDNVAPFFNIDAKYKDPDFFGIGGHIGSFLVKFFTYVGFLVDFLTGGIEYVLFELGELLHFNALLNELGVSDEAIDKAIHIISRVVFTATIAFFTGGITAIGQMTTTQIVIQTVSIVLSASMASESFDDEQEQKEMAEKEEQLQLASEELAKETDSEEDLDFNTSSIGDNKELMLALNYDPFLRIEMEQEMNYDSFNRFDNMDNYAHIMP